MSYMMPHVFVSHEVCSGVVCSIPKDKTSICTLFTLHVHIELLRGYANGSSYNLGDF